MKKCLKLLLVFLFVGVIIQSVSIAHANKDNSSESNGVKMTKANRDDLIKKLEELYVGNYEKLSKLKTKEQIQEMEAIDPYDESGLYYLYTLESGLQVSNSYILNKDNTRIIAITSITNMQLTSNNYMRTMNQLNKYLKTTAKSKKNASFTLINNENLESTAFDIKKKDKIFKKVMSGKDILGATYEIGDRRYQLLLTADENKVAHVVIASYFNIE